MTETPATNPLVQRLVVERLSAPGILDRNALQRAHERFSQPPSTQMLGRLHRRIASAVPSPESLPLVRVDRLNESGAAEFTSPVDALPSVAAIAADDRDVARSMASMSPVVGNLVARQTPGLTHAPEFVARRIAPAPSLIGGGRTIARLIERSGQTASARAPSIAPMAAATGVVQRVAERRDIARAAVAGESASATAGIAPIATASSRRITTHGSPAVPASPAVLRKVEPPMAVVGAAPAASNIVPTSTPLLWRKADATPQIQPLSALSAVTESSGVTAANPTQLLLRKSHSPLPGPALNRSTVPPDAVVMRAQMDASSATTFHTDPIARGASPRDASAPTVRGWTSAGGIDIDWIVEQVGSRLARRLEIERERQGVRQWRQVS